MTSEEWNDIPSHSPDTHLEKLKLKYPEHRLADEVAKIEKLGYEVWMLESCCAIYRLSDGALIIDADFRNSLYENAIDAFDSFWY